MSTSARHAPPSPLPDRRNPLRRGWFHRPLPWGILVLAIAPAQALAQGTSYSASTDCGLINLSPTPVDIDTCAQTGGCVGCGGLCPYAWSDAQSNDARLHATTRQVRYGGWNSCGGGWMSNASAYWRLSVIFSGPTGATSVTPTMVVPFRATIDVTRNPQANDGASFKVVTWIGDYVGFPFGGFGMGDGDGSLGWSTGGHNTPSPTAIDFAVLGSNTIEATGHQHGVRYPPYGPVALNQETPVWVGAEIHMHNGDFGDGSQTTDAHIWIEFGSAPVFLLPAGYSANSTDGRIVDNHWVDPRPFMTQQPAHALICPGGNTSFMVAATSQTPMSYQWRKAGTPLSDGGAIAGATTAMLTITGAQAADHDSYDCIVSNINGGTTSLAATLTICPADFDCSGVLGVQDIFDFLAGFFGGDPRADMNASSTISTQDIFDFLAMYFGGCI